MQTVSKTTATGGGSIDLFDNIGISEGIKTVSSSLLNNVMLDATSHQLRTQPPSNSTSHQADSIEISKPTSEKSETRKSTGHVANKKSVFASNNGSSSGSARKTKGCVPNKKSVAGSKAGSSHGSAYQYEIDCKKVADAIDVKDLVSQARCTFLRMISV